jgi:DNA-binding NtrC family response regulator
MTPEPAHSIVVVVEDSEAFQEMKRGLLPGFRAKLASNEHTIKEAVEDTALQAMLFDLDCVGQGAPDGIEVIQEIRALRDDIVLVAVTRSREHSIPLRASQAGADEFVVAPVNYDELQILIARAIEKRVLELAGRRVVEQAERRTALFSLIGASAAMQKLYQTIQAVADTNTTVVLRGESGTGKELIAQAIVQASDRANQPYICLNFSAMRRALLPAPTRRKPD